MASSTPFFQAFGPLLFGRRPRSQVEMVRRLSSLEELYGVFGDLFPERMLGVTKEGANSRRRSLPAVVTFWAFVSQVLSPKSSCREVVRKVEAWWRWQRLHSASAVSASAYCQARARLDLDTLRLIRRHLSWAMERHALEEERWLQGRPVKIVDGTNLSMPDNPANQQQWPQPSGQQVGCGFPMMKLVGLFSLSSGALLEEATGNQHVHESRLFQQLWERLESGDVILEDRGFCSYGAMAALWMRGVDTVARLHHARKADLRAGRALGPEDRLVTWDKPKLRPEGWSEPEWEALPQSLSTRLLRLHVEAKGFRTRTVLIATTLSDPKIYPATELRRLYGERWNVELHFAQIKTILGLDVLRCQSPAMIRKEVQIHLIAYNLIRALMQRAAHDHRVPLGRISFKGSLDTVRHWAAVIHASAGKRRKQSVLIARMLALIADDPVPERPHRSEPRVKKRRPKNYHLLTKPRHALGNLPHRNRPNTKSPKSVLS
jgi:Transposase DDE domain/Insertion element 4 transposase N-terminal